MNTESAIKDYYDRHHRELGKDSWRPPEAFPFFLNLVGVKPGKALLDVGCGTGYLLQAAGARGLSASGVDISEEAVRLAGEAAPEADIRQARGEELPFGDRIFDYVYSIGVLEHFLDIKKGILEMQRVAKPEALFCIVVPNANYLGWAWKIRKGTPQQDISERLYSRREWTDIFQACGLKVNAVYQDRWWFVNRWRYMKSRPRWKRFRAVIRGTAWCLMPLSRTYQFIFLMQRQDLVSASIRL